MKRHRKIADAELVERLKRDDQGAMKAIFERYWKKLFVVAVNRLSSPESAEECVSDVLISVWDRRHRLSLKYSLGTYLAVAVKYRAIRLLAEGHRQQVTMPVVSVSEFAQHYAASTVDEYMLEKELMDGLETAIRQLPEKCQLVYRMSSEQGKGYKQIAKELHLAEKTVQAHLTKATKSLRKQLSKQIPIF